MDTASQQQGAADSAPPVEDTPLVPEERVLNWADAGAEPDPAAEQLPLESQGEPTGVETEEPADIPAEATENDFDFDLEVEGAALGAPATDEGLVLTQQDIAEEEVLDFDPDALPEEKPELVSPASPHPELDDLVEQAETLETDQTCDDDDQISPPPTSPALVQEGAAEGAPDTEPVVVGHSSATSSRGPKDPTAKPRRGRASGKFLAQKNRTRRWWTDFEEFADFLYQNTSTRTTRGYTLPRLKWDHATEQQQQLIACFKHILQVAASHYQILTTTAAIFPHYRNWAEQYGFCGDLANVEQFKRAYRPIDLVDYIIPRAVPAILTWAQVNPYRDPVLGEHHRPGDKVLDLVGPRVFASIVAREIEVVSSQGAASSAPSSSAETRRVLLAVPKVPEPAVPPKDTRVFGPREPDHPPPSTAAPAASPGWTPSLRTVSQPKEVPAAHPPPKERPVQHTSQVRSFPKASAPGAAEKRTAAKSGLEAGGSAAAKRPGVTSAPSSQPPKIPPAPRHRPDGAPEGTPLPSPPAVPPPPAYPPPAVPKAVDPKQVGPKAVGRSSSAPPKAAPRGSVLRVLERQKPIGPKASAKGAASGAPAQVTSARREQAVDPTERVRRDSRQVVLQARRDHDRRVLLSDRPTPSDIAASDDHLLQAVQRFVTGRPNITDRPVVLTPANSAYPVTRIARDGVWVRIRQLNQDDRTNLVRRLEAIPGALAPGSAGSDPDPYQLSDAEWQHSSITSGAGEQTLVAPDAEVSHLPDNDPAETLEPSDQTQSAPEVAQDVDVEIPDAGETAADSVVFEKVDDDVEIEQAAEDSAQGPQADEDEVLEFETTEVDQVLVDLTQLRLQEQRNRSRSPPEPPAPKRLRPTTKHSGGGSGSIYLLAQAPFADNIPKTKLLVSSSKAAKSSASAFIVPEDPEGAASSAPRAATPPQSNSPEKKGDKVQPPPPPSRPVPVPSQPSAVPRAASPASASGTARSRTPQAGPGTTSSASASKTNKVVRRAGDIDPSSGVLYKELPEKFKQAQSPKADSGATPFHPKNPPPLPKDPPVVRPKEQEWFPPPQKPTPSAAPASASASGAAVSAPVVEASTPSAPETASAEGAASGAPENLQLALPKKDRKPPPPAKPGFAGYNTAQQQQWAADRERQAREAEVQRQAKADNDYAQHVEAIRRRSARAHARENPERASSQIQRSVPSEASRVAWQTRAINHGSYSSYEYPAPAGLVRVCLDWHKTLDCDLKKDNLWQPTAFLLQELKDVVHLAKGQVEFVILSYGGVDRNQDTHRHAGAFAEHCRRSGLPFSTTIVTCDRPIGRGGKASCLCPLNAHILVDDAADILNEAAECELICIQAFGNGYGWCDELKQLFRDYTFEQLRAQAAKPLPAKYDKYRQR